MIVHGACGGSWAFRRVASLLNEKGYTVNRTSLTGLGECVHLATKDVGLSTHINDVINMLLFEDLRDVVHADHSYGGMVITGVAEMVRAGGFGGDAGSQSLRTKLCLNALFKSVLVKINSKEKIEMPCAYPYAVLHTILILTATIIAPALSEMVFPASIAASTAQAKLISIAGARKLPLATVVTVEGSVTVPSGAFKSSISDEGFAIQDHSAGIYISTTENYGFRVGQRVRVRGKLVENNSMLGVRAAGAESIEARGNGRKLKPKAVSTGKVGEATEGRLVKVTGTITRPLGDDAPYGFRLFINDGTGEVQVFISASTGINPRGWQMGQRVSVIGLGAQYKDHYEINPRFTSDISLFSISK